MRVMIKGGIWKNTEDEILKASVMKYGLNQWPRVASLLNRKSAKQCKARWFEWLDPSIKKIEWTREEEEKLLHLAKLFPKQWRTIAPHVGRTAAQCIEHYERLIDAAQRDIESNKDEDGNDIDEQKAGSSSSSSGGGGRGDPRRLRPGEIDPAPETKPARPDPIDMDDDEKEMLSEARARLANTQGKKAKRKTREKQLEEAKRLATLQKRRELKAAGIEQKYKAKKRRYIDYGTEIPFQMKAPAGFYDVGDERENTKKLKLDPESETLRLDQIENKRRDEEENRRKQEDKKRQKKLLKSNLPSEINKINALNDPISIRQRSAMVLPAPQVTDAELEQVVKSGQQQQQQQIENNNSSSSNGVTGSLLGTYESEQRNAFPTPMRTPMTQSQDDVIMQEAKNQILLRNRDTPLHGGDTKTLYDGTGFTSATPQRKVMSTPNTMGQKLGLLGSSTQSVAGTVMTPGTIRSEQSSRLVGGTPMRDALHLNDEVKEKMYSSSTLLKDGLNALPAPQYEVEFSLPEVEQEKEEMQIEEDAEERDARLARMKKEAMEAELARRSTVLKNGDLPRPKSINNEKILGKANHNLDDKLDLADYLIKEEMIKLLRNDNFKYPIKSDTGKKKRKRVTADSVQIEKFKDEELANARAVMENELEVLKKQKGDIDLEEFSKAWKDTYADIAYFPSREAFGRLANANLQDKVDAVKYQFAALEGILEKDAKKIQKLEERVSLRTNGYVQRSKVLKHEIQTLRGDLETAVIELSCFKMLKKGEDMAIPKRLNELTQQLEACEKEEMVLQEKYADVYDELQTLEESMA